MTFLYFQLARLVLSYRWRRGWYYWRRDRQRAAFGQWRRLPQALGLASPEAYTELGQELRLVVGEAAAQICFRWARRRGKFDGEFDGNVDGIGGDRQPNDNSAREGAIASIADSSLEDLERACQEQPDDPEVWKQLGQFYEKRSWLEKAIRAYLKMVELGTPTQPVLYWTHLFYLNIPDRLVPWVIDEYKRLGDRYPNCPEPPTNLGKLLSDNQRPEEAIAAYRQASRLSTQKQCRGKLPPEWDSNTNFPPNFLIIGAQKCGTSSLYVYLAKHPQILPSITKEINFFSEYHHYGLPWYLAQFPQLRPNDRWLTGEASPSYFDHPDAAHRIYDQLPTVKLILMVRNPADRFISQYHHYVRKGYETRSLPDTIQTALDYWSAIAPETVSHQYHTDYKKHRDRHDYFYHCLYGHHLEPWLQHFPREQLLILTLEEMARSPRQTLNQTCEFLGISDLELEQYPRVNSGQYQSHRDHNWQALANAFVPHNQHLEHRLNRRFLWS